MTDGAIGLSAADVAAVTRNNDNDDMWGGNCWIWIIFIAFLFPMMMGGWNRGGVETGVQDNFISDEFVKRDIFNTNQNVSNTACQTQREVLENRYAAQLGFQNLGTQVQVGNCNTQKEILQNRYDAALMAQNMQAQMAQYCCDIKEAVLADGNATRQLMQENTIQGLRDKLADRDRDLQTAYWQISQVNQTKSIVDAVRPTSKPAYLTCSPYFAYNASGLGGCCGNGGNVL